MVRVQNNDGQIRVTIPKDIAKLKGWKQGTEVAIALDSSGNVVIMEIKGGKK